MTPWPIRPLLGLLLSLALVAPAAAATPADNDEARRLHALFERHWDESARRFPEWATFRGDHRFDDRLNDASARAVAADEVWQRQAVAEARRIRRDRLGTQDRISLDLFIDGLERRLALNAFDGHRRQSLGSQFGFQTRLASLMRASPPAGAARAEALLARLRAYPLRVDQEIEWVRGAIALGWITARPVLQRSLAQIDGQLAPAPRDGPFFEHFRGLPADLPERASLHQRAEAAIAEQVLPAQRKLRRFIAEELLPLAPPDGGLSRYPDGAAVYAQLVRQHTTTELTPQQVHDIGLREVARLRTEIAKVQAQMKVDGDLAALVAQLNRPTYFHATREAMLEDYRAIAKRIDPHMPALFAELPRAPYGIRAQPDFVGPGAADNYSRPAPDGSQPGWYNANTLAYQRRARWAMPTLVAHEAVPGHHLQAARAVEIGALPAFRRQGFITAYGEGWALYAETLGLLFNLYDTPEAMFGHLQAQIFRAARLVVDTGLHTMDWPRQRAIDYLIEHTGQAEDFIVSEVDRYLSSPGQALSYMIGKLKFDELRDRAKTALGPRFDLRRFHNAVLDDGALPLTLLERRVDEWIETQRTR